MQGVSTNRIADFFHCPIRIEFFAHGGPDTIGMTGLFGAETGQCFLPPTVQNTIRNDDNILWWHVSAHFYGYTPQWGMGIYETRHIKILANYVHTHRSERELWHLSTYHICIASLGSFFSLLHYENLTNYGGFFAHYLIVW